MTPFQPLENGIRYIPGEEVYFHRGSKIDVSRFSDVQKIWVDPYFECTPKDQFSLPSPDAAEFTVLARGYELYFPDMKDGKPVVTTLDQAVRECVHWETRADTIGGRARILHVPTGNVLKWKEYVQ